jgi:hypothetical protein
MLNFGKKIYALHDKKNKYSNSRVVRKKISERNKKPYQILINVDTMIIIIDFNNEVNIYIATYR